MCGEAPRTVQRPKVLPVKSSRLLLLGSPMGVRWGISLKRLPGRLHGGRALGLCGLEHLRHDVLAPFLRRGPETLGTVLPHSHMHSQWTTVRAPRLGVLESTVNLPNFRPTRFVWGRAIVKSSLSENGGGVKKCFDKMRLLYITLPGRKFFHAYPRVCAAQLGGPGGTRVVGLSAGPEAPATLAPCYARCAVS